jgi:hypothetical protein
MLRSPSLGNNLESRFFYAISRIRKNITSGKYDAMPYHCLRISTNKNLFKNLTYLLTNLTAQKPITKLERVRRKKKHKKI